MLNRQHLPARSVTPRNSWLQRSQQLEGAREPGAGSQDRPSRVRRKLWLGHAARPVEDAQGVSVTNRVHLLCTGWTVSHISWLWWTLADLWGQENATRILWNQIFVCSAIDFRRWNHLHCYRTKPWNIQYKYIYIKKFTFPDPAPEGRTETLLVTYIP